MNDQIKEVEIIRVVEKGKEQFHRKPASWIDDGDVWRVPEAVFKAYVIHRGTKEYIPKRTLRQLENVTIIRRGEVHQFHEGKRVVIDSSRYDDEE